jgi:hypothetical protein
MLHTLCHVTILSLTPHGIYRNMYYIYDNLLSPLLKITVYSAIGLENSLSTSRVLILYSNGALRIFDLQYVGQAEKVVQFRVKVIDLFIQCELSLYSWSINQPLSILVDHHYHKSSYYSFFEISLLIYILHHLT